MGLTAYRAIAADARRLLAPDGTLVVELGAGQAAAVTALLGAAGLGLAGPPRHDLAGVARALVARPAAMNTITFQTRKKALGLSRQDRLGSGHGIDPRLSGRR